MLQKYMVRVKYIKYAINRIKSMQQLSLHLQRILDLLFPPQCVICKRGGHVLCPRCLSSIQPLRPPFCLHCGTQLIAYEQCRNCRHKALRLSILRVFGRYEGALRACIHALKYDGQKRLAEPLGKLLAQAYITYGLQADLVIPVPLHKEREQQRGFSQTTVLARHCAKQLGLPLREDILQRIRATSAQVGLNGQERQRNVAGAFACVPQFTTGALFGRTILMIDDVCTTGSTLEASAAPLFAAGARNVCGLVLAGPT
jgi:ComF family protein